MKRNIKNILVLNVNIICKQCTQKTRHVTQCKEHKDFQKFQKIYDEMQKSYLLKHSKINGSSGMFF
jgi:hypothetical protein